MKYAAAWACRGDAVTQRRVVIEESVSLSLGNYLADPAGLTMVLEAIDALAEDPRPAKRGALGPGHDATAYRSLPRAV